MSAQLSKTTNSESKAVQSPAVSVTDQSRFLRRVLWGNAIFSTLCALIILIDLGPVSHFLGWPLQWPLALIGVGLLPFAFFVAYVARQQPLQKSLTWVVIEMDVLWVLASIIVLVVGWPASTTVAGKWTIGAVAEVVALFAILQYVGVRRLGNVEK